MEEIYVLINKKRYKSNLENILIFIYHTQYPLTQTFLSSVHEGISEHLTLVASEKRT